MVLFCGFWSFYPGDKACNFKTDINELSVSMLTFHGGKYLTKIEILLMWGYSSAEIFGNINPVSALRQGRDW